MNLAPVHVLAGTIAILAGFTALYSVKGLKLHRKSGMVFVCVMLVMAISGTVMAFGHPGTALNVPAGLVTAYLVITALATVRPRTVGSRRLDQAAMIAAFAIGAGALLTAVSGRVRGGMAYPLVMFALVALFAGEGDRRMIRAGGLKGAARLRRHLWRMCTALFIAAGSFFLGPVRRIPEPLREPIFRLIPLVVLLTMAYWLWRYRRKRISRDVSSPGGFAPPDPPTRELAGTP
jgi:uncharacterized membrane protein